MSGILHSLVNVKPASLLYSDGSSREGRTVRHYFSKNSVNSVTFSTCSIKPLEMQIMSKKCQKKYVSSAGDDFECENWNRK